MKSEEQVTTGVQKISAYLNWVAIIVLLPTTMIFITIEVLLRYVFNAPIRGADEISNLMFMGIVLSSLSYCWVQRGHIRIDILIVHFSPKWKARMWALAAAVGFFVFVLMAYQSIINILYSVKVHETTQELQLVLWPFRIYFFLCALLFSGQLFFSIFDFLGEGRTGEGD